MNETQNPSGSEKPAFPQPLTRYEGDEGITVHDYFYAKALQAFIQAAAFNQGAEDMLKKVGITGAPRVQEFICSMAHDFATAAIEERQKGASK